MLRCPKCGGALTEAGLLVRCATCGPYPLLGDVPVLVEDPFAYCETFRDAILAAMAEHGVAEREAVAVVEAFAGDERGALEHFGDDWTLHETRGTAAPAPVKGVGAAPLKKLMQVALVEGPAAWLDGKIKKVTLALELGCGAGERSEVLASRVERLVVADLSLRAVFRARARASRHDADVVGVVLNAEVLPVKRRAFDLVVAEHLVDLLDAPADFFTQVHAALAKGGRLLVTTPDPGLGKSFDEVVSQLAVAAKFKVVERKDGLPWLRVNSSRFVEIYLVQALELSAG